MKRVLFMAVLLAATPLMAQEREWVGYDNRWYAGLMGGVARPGSDRLGDSTEGYYGFYLGRFFSPNVSLDVQIDTYSTDFRQDRLDRAGVTLPPGASNDFDIYGYGLTGRYHFGDEGNRHRPYALVGVGIQEHDNFFDEDGRDIYVSWGLGLQSKFGDHVRSRLQLEGRYDNDRDTRSSNKGFVDMIVSVGLGVSFGQPPRPPRPAEPAPAPQPRPVAPTPAPAPAPAPEPEPEVLFEFDAMVLFDFDSATLRQAARAELDDAARILDQRREIILIEVAGHTDSTGPEDYNQRLSERRAQSVADYLAGQGIARDRMRVVGYGETRPKVPNDTPHNRQLNRRVVIS
ncbi:MAG: OmpA family protein, partial [Wenzhouxiangellaceae bacterium]